MLKELRIKIFVSAYACEPDLGSEIGVGWHWVLEMNKYFELWVLTRRSNKTHIEDWLGKHPQEHEIHFLYWDLPDWARKWKKGLRGVRTYYNIWQYYTDRIVKATMKQNDIKIYHLLTYGNALWPASSYGQKQFFVWGPIGGVDTIPEDYTRFYGRKWKVIELLRRIIIMALPFNNGFQKRCKNADLMFCKSYSMKDAIAEKYRHKAMVCTDVAVELVNNTQYARKRQHNDGLVRFLMVGRLDAWRGFDLAIEAVAQAIKICPQIRLDILGKGSDRERIITWIEKFDVKDYVTLHGQVPMDEYYQMMADCDVVLNPCLKEGAVTTAFDSMSFGKPLICIDTGGYTRYFTDEYAVLIEKKSRYKEISDIVDAIVRLSDREERNKMGEKALKAGGEYTWENKGLQIREAIMNAYSRDQNR